jgi:hypothetical protein
VHFIRFVREVEFTFLSGISEIPIPFIHYGGNVMVLQSLVVGSYLRSVKRCCGATVCSFCLLSVQLAFVTTLHTFSSSIRNSIPGSLSVVVPPPNKRPSSCRILVQCHDSRMQPSGTKNVTSLLTCVAKEEKD